MRVIIFGANGGVGTHAVSHAINAGHSVVAVARDRDSIVQRAENLTRLSLRVADDPTAVRESLVDADAVVSALGNPLIFAGKTGPKMMEQAWANIVSGLPVPTTRFVGILSYGAGSTAASAPLPIKLLAATLLRKDFADLNAAHELLPRSNSVVGYFGYLTDGPEERYETDSTLRQPSPLGVSRRTIGRFLVEHLESSASQVSALAVRQVRSVSNG